MGRGFSLIELIVVIGVCAMAFTGAALAVRSIAITQQRATDFLKLPSGTVAINGAGGLHPSDTRTAIDSFTAPNTGRAVLSEAMRSQFYQDAERSVAVFALPRIGNTNTIRPSTIPFGPDYRGKPMRVTTPERFRDLLIDARVGNTTARLFPTAATTFVEFRGAPPRTVSVSGNNVPVTNATIFMLGYSSSSVALSVRNIYEIDYAAFDDTSTSLGADQYLPCVFASVRRFGWIAVGAGGSMDVTDSYDIVYRDATLQDIGVPFAHFERRVRLNDNEGGTIDRFKRAKNQPFYMIWWPDPMVQNFRDSAAETIRRTASSTTYSASSPQAAYWEKENTTSLLFIIPQFPVL
jgi:prepilin-type N-terminal cleavage/methylation domain-containing protein